MSLRDYFFYAEISRGFVIKTLVDVLAGCLNRATFTLSGEGIFLCEYDRGRSVLFNARLLREKFKRYKCAASLVLSVNIKHVQRLIRSLKKKDSLLLSIANTPAGPAEMLSITIRPAGAKKADAGNRVETSNVKFQVEEFYTPKDVPPQDHYEYPYVIESADFQRVKRIAALDKTIKITVQGDNFLSFTCNRDCFASGLEFGTRDASADAGRAGHERDGKYADESDADESDSESDSDESDAFELCAPPVDVPRLYEAQFHSSMFTYLVKLPGLCSQIQFYAPTKLGSPLRLKMEAGRLGELEIYIKDIQKILEDSEKEECVLD